MTKQRRRSPQKSLNPGQILALGFLVLIVCGGFLLVLPAASATRRSLGLLKAMFTAASAVCVTGLPIIEAGADLSLLGQVILLFLIQVGGLGFMVFASLGMRLIGRRISLRGRMLLSESMNQSQMSGIARLSLTYLVMTALVELSGAAVLALRFVPEYGAGRGLFVSLFTSVSAFCNAGFDVFGQSTGILPWQGDAVVMLTIVALTMLGSVGFITILELLSLHKNEQRISLQTRLVLWTNAILLLGGTVLVYLMERGNAQTLAAEGMNEGVRWLSSLSHSAACRSTGFSGLEQAALKPATKLFSCVMMFIGASPASNGGGVKTTTFALVGLMIFAEIRGRDHITVFGREVPSGTVRRAVALVAIALVFVILASGLICILEDGRGFSPLDLIYEAFAALSTAGMTSVGTANLTVPSQLLLMVLMYLGKVGPLSLAVALAGHVDSSVKNRIRHPDENVMIG